MKCPKCGKELIKKSGSTFELYVCPDEDFKIYTTIYGRKFTDKELESFLEEGTTPYLSGFRKKDGTPYSARLKFDADYKISLYWEKGDGQDPELVCPKCGKPIRKNSKAWGCSGWKEGCDFVVWSTIAGHSLTDSEKNDLIKKGETNVINDFVSKSNKHFSAKLVLDENKKVSFKFNTRKKQ